MKGREHVCRHRWSRKISMKVDGIGAFSQHSCRTADKSHTAVEQLIKATVLAESSYSVYFY